MNLFNSLVVNTLPLIPKSIVRKFANRYIAGETLTDAIRVTKSLNQKGLMATMDVLGEDISTREEALASTNECLNVLDAIKKNNLDANLSLKLTQIGLKMDYSFCLDNLQKIIERGADLGIFVRIDMEDSTCTTDTLKIVTDARIEFENCGYVVQAYLKRTYDDVKNIIEKSVEPVSFRLCKGIYNEPEEIAYKTKDKIISNFLKVLRLMFEKSVYVGIATHNSHIIEGALELIDEFKKNKNDYEFQMLLGVRETLRDDILKQGHRLRIYIPYGKHWYKYSIRRFKENPEIAGYVLKSVFRRG